LTLSSTLSNGTYIYTLPSATGTLALTSALSGYLPLTGGTLTGTSASTVLSLANSTGGTKADFTITENTGLIINSYEGPSARSINLQVAGTSALLLASTGAATFSSSVTAQSGTFSLASTGSGAVVNVGNVGSGVFGGLAITDGGTYPMKIWGSELQFLTGSSVFGSAFTKLTITSGGNVGIGTTAPVAALDVLKTSSTLYAPLSEASRFPTASQIYLNNSNAANNSFAGITFQVTRTSGINSNAYIGAVSSATNPEIVFGQRDGGNNLYAEAMRITSGGNVLIGTTTNNGNKLQVEGTASFKSSISITSSNLPTYFGITSYAAQDNNTVTLSTILPSLSYSGTFISLLVQIVATNGSGGINSSTYNCSRTDALVWTTNLINSTGAAPGYTFTFGGTAAAPTLAITNATYIYKSVAYQILMR
jgi:hypothetical protein